MKLRLILLCALLLSSCATVREKPVDLCADASSGRGALEQHSHHKEKLDKI